LVGWVLGIYFDKKILAIKDYYIDAHEMLRLPNEIKNGI